MKQSRLISFALLSIPCLIVPTLRAQTPATSASVDDRRKALNTLFHDYWEDVLKHDPEFASSIGDLRYNDQLDNLSVQAYNDQLAREQKYMLQLAAIDNTGFSSEEKTSQELLMRSFELDQEAAQFKEWEMPNTEIMEGFYGDFPQLPDLLSFNTVKDYDDWIARLHAMPKAFDQETANMTLGMKDGHIPPKYLLVHVLEQMKQLANQKPEDSPFASPLKKFPAAISAAEQARIRTEMLDAIGKEVLPAYLRFVRFLEVSYVPAGRDKPGIDSIPDGAKYYGFLIREMTTTNLTAPQIHQIGLDEVQKDEAGMLAIAQKLGFQDLKSFRASLKDNAKLHPASGPALMDAYRNVLKPMQAKLPDYFGRLPKAPFEMAEVPDYMAKTSPPAYYQAGSPDGKRPGRLFVNTSDAVHRNLYSIESIAYHEGIPGHHLQISISQEQQGVPEFRKYGGYTAFVEGWALYSERLGKDMGFYQDPYSDYGRLENDVWRGIRLVVDTGVHSQGWTRDQMVQYFHDHSNIDEPSVQTEVDRYIAWPGQALAYKTGQLKILELRARAQKELGAKFDIRAFHDQVIDSGALPLDVLEQHIDAWIATQKAN